MWLIRFYNPRYFPPRIEVHTNRIKEIKRLISQEHPLVVDGGSHKGEFIDNILIQYSSPKIYAYEPIPFLVKELKKKYQDKKNIIINQLALGAANKAVELNIFRKIGASSILESGYFADTYHSNGMNIDEKIIVSQVRLDECIYEEIDIFKLDLQGYELSALEGASEILDKVKLILVEIEFVELYKNQPLFADIDSFLRANGFRLYNLFDLYTHDDGQLTSGDAIYLNNNYFQ